MKIWSKEEEGEALRKRFDDLKKNKGISRAAFARENEIKGGDSIIYQHITGHRPMSIDAAIAYAKGFACELHEISPRLAIEAKEMAVAIGSGNDLSPSPDSNPAAIQEQTPLTKSNEQEPEDSDISLSGRAAEAAKLVAAMTDKDQIEILHWLRVEASRRRHAEIVAQHTKK
jgi:hypothetical protein